MNLIYQHKKGTFALNLEPVGDEFEIELNGERTRARVIAIAPPRITFLYREKSITARVASDGKKRWVHVGGVTFLLERVEPTSQRAHAHGSREGTGSGIVVAPMPGQVRAVLVREGEPVTEGQALVLLEAMKMEFRVASPHDGIVAKIHVTPGQNVERDQILGEITEIETEAAE